MGKGDDGQFAFSLGGLDEFFRASARAMAVVAISAAQLAAMSVLSFLDTGFLLFCGAATAALLVLFDDGAV